MYVNQVTSTTFTTSQCHYRLVHKAVSVAQICGLRGTQMNIQAFSRAAKLLVIFGSGF